MTSIVLFHVTYYKVHGCKLITIKNSTVLSLHFIVWRFFILKKGVKLLEVKINREIRYYTESMFF
jgi:hypothetical protein